jgi:hypothetical protein
MDVRWCLVSQRNNLGTVQCRLVRVSAIVFHLSFIETCADRVRGDGLASCPC